MRIVSTFTVVLERNQLLFLQFARDLSDTDSPEQKQNVLTVFVRKDRNYCISRSGIEPVTSRLLSRYTNQNKLVGHVVFAFGHYTCFVPHVFQNIFVPINIRLSESVEGISTTDDHYTNIQTGEILFSVNNFWLIPHRFRHS